MNSIEMIIITLFHLSLLLFSTTVIECFSFSSSLFVRRAFTSNRIYSGSNDFGSDHSEDGDENGSTLYDILRCPQNSTRRELKFAYGKMAKMTHPDALLRIEEDNNRGNDYPDFNEVARAWEVLSDPRGRRKYDRTLRAQVFTRGIENMISLYGDQAAPVVNSALEDVALPFLRRTAATALAGLGGAERAARGDFVNDVIDTENVGLAYILQEALRAGSDVNRQIDLLELEEKGKKIVERVEKESVKFLSLQDDLNKVTTERLKLSLRTPYSKLSWIDALRILDGFNTSDTVTVLDSLMLRQTISSEIDQLQRVEEVYNGHDKEFQNMKKDFETNEKAMLKAEKKVSAAILAEEKAQRLLDEAKSILESATKNSVKCTKEYTSVKDSFAQKKKVIEKVSKSLEKTQEKVRLVLRNKEDALKGQRNETITDAESHKDINLYSDTDENATEKNRIKFEILQKKESNLIAESSKVESQVDKLQVKAQRLFQRFEQKEGK